MARIRTLRVAVVFACLAGLAGCAVQSPPVAEAVRKDALPATEVPAGWKAAGAPAPVDASPVQDDWLSTFGDAQLDALVAEAIRNNTDLRAAAARVEQAAAYSTAAQAALLPALNVIGTGGVKAGGGSDLTSALQGIMLGISWEPDLWGRLRYGRNAADATYASAQADLEFARQSLAAQVARSWFVAIESRITLEAADAMVASGRSLVSLAEDRQRVGNGNARETAAARATLGNLEDAAAQARFANQQAVRSLEVLLGRYPGADLAVATALPALPGPVPVGMPLDMLARRPDLIAAQRRVDAAFDRVGEAQAAMLPTIRLNASIAALSSDVLQLKQDYSNPSGGAGGTLFAPVYRGGALKAQVAARTAEQKEAVALYGSQVLRALGDVESSLSASAILAQRVDALGQALSDQQRALELEEQAYRVGRTDLRSVEAQRQQVQSAQIAYVRAEREQLSQRVNLHLALGGSFAEPVTVASSR
ncbi:MAG: efflux transporter outer membrane subunit [Steroidobacteraceae bacterium]